MHIRHAGQLEDLTPADRIRWRTGVLTEIALQLAQMLRIPILIDHPRQFLVTTISSRN